MCDPIPASIVKAICQIKASMGAVAKSQYNKHGGYNFSSTDDIYASLTRKMGEVGLVCLGLEEFCEVKRFDTTDKDGNPKTSQWAHLEFSFVWATESDTWTDKKAKRTLYIQVNGPQTFQAAQSYAEKAYLRSTFKIPTGDHDLDSMPQGETEDDQVALAAPRKPKSSSKAKKDGDNETFNEIVKQVKSAPTLEVLEQIPVLWADEIGQLPRRWHDLFQDEYEDRCRVLNPSAMAAE